MSVLYPSAEGSTFDLDYYKEQHMAIVHRAMPGVLRTEVDKPLNGPYAAIGHLYFADMGAFQAATSASTAGEAAADVANFTNIQPVVQVSEILG
jgi:uncharacterized protein (TIGR02118 family)